MAYSEGALVIAQLSCPLPPSYYFIYTTFPMLLSSQFAPFAIQRFFIQGFSKRVSYEISKVWTDHQSAFFLKVPSKETILFSQHIKLLNSQERDSISRDTFVNGYANSYLNKYKRVLVFVNSSNNAQLKILRDFRVVAQSESSTHFLVV